ncbi:MAG: NAD(P)/FAD-dependent oxidoreductase [Acidobacteria bacterium]|nr:NAD(P)/FAD-dependent oxidoreductase [Acidobacteriota bacterium]
MEAGMCRGGDIVVVGGGNSAGQAAVFLSKCAAKVRLVVRSESLAKSMSRYLIDRIENTENIQLLTQAQVGCVNGNGTVQSVRIKQADGQSEEVQTAGVFVMVGADPGTSWLRGVVGLDAKGFVVTGRDARKHPDFARHWHQPRDPHDLETTCAGVFAVGDVRSGSTKRVASAVGEGSMAVRYVHEMLAE